MGAMVDIYYDMDKQQVMKILLTGGIFLPFRILLILDWEKLR